ncbi:UNVERIFIED_ORG: flagellar motility protein MotE (MotC chaperone) [Arthrobacter sp. UYEF13]
MDFYAINALRENHAGWSLLRAQNAPLAVSFFIKAFTGPNQRDIGRQELIDHLDDVLFGLREVFGEDKYPRPAGEYLDEWAAPERAWLRKYYVPGQDEPRYDLTAAAEDVVRWVESLSGRDFVATQSRLTSIFAVLKALVQQSETDPEVRLAELQRQRDGIDAEMQRIKDGNIRVMTGPEALDHFQQLTTLAKDLLSDFREVEQNFRKLDRQVREQIATWDGSQGELLASIFANQQDISGSLQGRTFQGFWDYLMSPQLRTELRDLLHRATQIDALAKLDNLHAVTNLHQDWLPAVEQTQATVRQLSQQMRRLLDDKVFLENKRIMQLVRSIESGALGTREVPPSGVFMEIAAQSVDVALPFERPLYEPSRRIMVDDIVVAADDTEVDAGALFSQFHVDTERLKSNIDDVLAGAEQATLGEVAAAHPLSQGLAEIVAYYQLATESEWAAINPDESQQLSWQLPDGSIREATVEQIIFVRPA